MKNLIVNGKLIDEVTDVLYEIGNVGVATAIVALGNYRKMEFRVGIPEVWKVSQDIYSQIQYKPDQIVVGVKTKVDKTMEGSILYLLSMEFAKNTVESMIGETIEIDELLENEESVSALQEIINYMTAGYVKVIGTYLKAPIYISAASIGIGSVKDFLEKSLSELHKDSPYVACVNTSFSVVDHNGNKTDENGQILILPEKTSIEGLIDVMINKPK